VKNYQALVWGEGSGVGPQRKKTDKRRYIIKVSFKKGKAQASLGKKGSEINRS